MECHEKSELYPVAIDNLVRLNLIRFDELNIINLVEDSSDQKRYDHYMDILEELSSPEQKRYNSYDHKYYSDILYTLKKGVDFHSGISRYAEIFVERGLFEISPTLTAYDYYDIPAHTKVKIKAYSSQYTSSEIRDDIIAVVKSVCEKITLTGFGENFCKTCIK